MVSEELRTNLLALFIWKTTIFAHQNMQLEIVTNRFGVPQGSVMKPIHQYNIH